jgi:hypothetical protein
MRFSTIVPESRSLRIAQRDVAVLAARGRHLLVHGHVQRADQRSARLSRLDHVVDVAALCRVVRIGKLLAVVLDELLGALLGILRLGDVALEDDADCTLGAHHGDLRGGPGHVVVSANVLRAHDVVRSAVRLAGDDGELGYGRLAVGVEQLGAVPDDAAILLIGAR